MNEPGRTRALTAMATAAAAVAVVMVLVTAAVATQQFARSQNEDEPVADPPSRSSSIEYPSQTEIAPKVFEGGQIVYSDTASNAYFEVPPSKDGWTISSSLQDWVEIPHVIVGPKPRILQPARYGMGYCKSEPETARAFVGLGVPKRDSDDVRGANEQLLESWRAALAKDAKKEQQKAPIVQPARELTLDDGTTAWMSSLRSPWQPGKGGCGFRWIGVSLLSIDTGRNIATMTAFSNLGTEADVPPERLRASLESVRPLPPD